MHAYPHVDGIFIQHIIICFVVITEEKVGILAQRISEGFQIARICLLKFWMEKNRKSLALWKAELFAFTKKFSVKALLNSAVNL